ncbi:hypothetical protein ILUMI_02949 [Ignelater luminosus]|uniref:Uncharacterized protein n=1 Tax=Ignelater luminosus TaxID=2038154 RepID=A0A8K0DMT1_IGNLU|nr:hypothetical protein ILUMI_02949 [Ignelater luminosus]
MKCMNNCLWYLSLKLGAYLICFVFLLTSITICILINARIITGVHVFPSTLKVLIVVLAVTHGLLFVSTCALLYALCMEKLWPLLLFILITIIVAINEIIIISYIIAERDSLPDEAVKLAAGQSFILFGVVYSAVEVFSLYWQWRQDILDGRPPHTTFEE